ncbi:MAG: helix-turn-helix domain-containing protein, partial [Actinomycetota bacterium]
IGTVDDAGVPLDPAQGRVYGIQRSMSLRRLSGAGWTVAARTSVGGLGVFLGGPARAAADRQLTFEAIPGLDGSALVDGVRHAEDRQTRIDLLRAALADLVTRRDADVVAEAREVVALVSRIEHDRSICQVEQLAREVGVSVRSLQRQFDTHVGASPSFVIRRWRIIEAAEAARAATEAGTGWRGWAAVAAELGYADQAHLTRDFTSTLGLSPTAYVARNRRP